MQIGDTSKRETFTFGVSGSGAHLGNKVVPSSKSGDLSSPLHRSLRRSVLRLLSEECGNFLLRIRAILQTTKNPVADSGPCCLSDYRLLLACNRDMTELQKNFRWLGLLNVELAFQAWILGAESALRISRTEKGEEERIQSSMQHPSSVVQKSTGRQ